MAHREMLRRFSEADTGFVIVQAKNFSNSAAGIQVAAAYVLR